jgi:predicted nucleic acid-binding protein
VRVVFDTNVVASASFWRGAPFECLAAWAQGRCVAVVSAALLAEYHETIDELRLDYPDRKCVAWVEVLTDDEMILECALAAEADFIVSGDKKHLLMLREFQGIPIVSPAEFLRKIKV